MVSAPTSPVEKTFFPPNTGKVVILFPSYPGGRISCYAVDIWAAGVSLFVCVTGTNPFPIKRLDYHMETMAHYATLPAMAGLSPELTQLLSACLSPKLGHRLTIDAMLVCFLSVCYRRSLRGSKSTVTVCQRSDRRSPSGCRRRITEKMEFP